MLIEAVEEPVTYRWPSGEIRLEPGCPVYLPESRALRLLAKAQGRVRLAEPANPEWLAEWRTLARIINGITADDSRFQPVMATLEQCDTAYLAGDWPAFHQAIQRVCEAVERGATQR